MPRLTSAASVNTLLWTMPPYTRPTAPPLIAAVARSGVACPVFKRYLMTDDDLEYLRDHGMPNGTGYGIDYTPAPEGFVNIGRADPVPGKQGVERFVGRIV